MYGVALYSFLVVFLAVSQAANNVPSRFASRNPFRDAPIWISAQEAISPNGSLQSNAVAPVEKRILNSEIEKPSRTRARVEHIDAGSCDVSFGSPYDDAPNMSPATSWAAVRERAQRGVVLRGNVAAIEAGLYAGLPFSVIRVNLSEPDENGHSAAFLLYPYAALNVDGMRICTADVGYSALPSSGDEIVFVASDAIDTGGSLYRVPPEQIIYQHGKSIVIAPRLRFDDQLQVLDSLPAVAASLGKPTPRQHANPKR